MARSFVISACFFYLLFFSLFWSTGAHAQSQINSNVSSQSSLSSDNFCLRAAIPLPGLCYQSQSVKPDATDSVFIPDLKPPTAVSSSSSSSQQNSSSSLSQSSQSSRQESVSSSISVTKQEDSISQRNTQSPTSANQSNTRRSVQTSVKQIAAASLTRASQAASQRQPSLAVFDSSSSSQFSSSSSSSSSFDSSSSQATGLESSKSDNSSNSEIALVSGVDTGDDSGLLSGFGFVAGPLDGLQMNKIVSSVTNDPRLATFSLILLLAAGFLFLVLRVKSDTTKPAKLNDGGLLGAKAAHSDVISNRFVEHTYNETMKKRLLVRSQRYKLISQWLKIAGFTYLTTWLFLSSYLKMSDQQLSQSDSLFNSEGGLVYL